MASPRRERSSLQMHRHARWAAWVCPMVALSVFPLAGGVGVELATPRAVWVVVLKAPGHAQKPLRQPTTAAAPADPARVAAMTAPALLLLSDRLSWHCIRLC